MLPFFFFALLMVYVYFIRIQQSLIRKLYFCSSWTWRIMLNDWRKPSYSRLNSSFTIPAVPLTVWTRMFDIMQLLLMARSFLKHESMHCFISYLGAVNQLVLYLLLFRHKNHHIAPMALKVETKRLT